MFVGCRAGLRSYIFCGPARTATPATNSSMSDAPCLEHLVGTALQTKAPAKKRSLIPLRFATETQGRSAIAMQAGGSGKLSRIPCRSRAATPDHPLHLLWESRVSRTYRARHALAQIMATQEGRVPLVPESRMVDSTKSLQEVVRTCHAELTETPLTNRPANPVPHQQAVLTKCGFLSP